MRGYDAKKLWVVENGTDMTGYEILMQVIFWLTFLLVLAIFIYVICYGCCGGRCACCNSIKSVFPVRNAQIAWMTDNWNINIIFSNIYLKYFSNIIFQISFLNIFWKNFINRYFQNIYLKDILERYIRKIFEILLKKFIKISFKY